MAALHLVGVTGPAGAESARVADVTLSVDAGELLALVGPSGAGKTTLLRLIAGLDPLAAGTIRLGDQTLDDRPAAQRGVGLVTPHGALQPHLDVADNVAFPLRLGGVEAGERRRRVHAETSALGLRRVLRRRPRTLSAGERQATALAREMARLPSVLLLDEPMAGLDSAERVRLRRELAVYLRGLGAPTLLATNDQTEAISLGDRLAVLVGGRIVQIGEPQQVYDEPATAFVASFLGDPGANLLPGRVEVGARTVQVRVGDGAWPIEPATGSLRRLDGAEVLVAVRPEHVIVERATRPAGVSGTVTYVEWLGSHTLCHVAVADVQQSIAARVAGDAPRAGERVSLLVDVTSHLRLFDTAGDRLPLG